MATVTVDGYEVSEATCRIAREDRVSNDRRPLCRDCAAALGGRRMGLPKRDRGQACWSCLEAAREADAAQIREEVLEQEIDAGLYA